MTANAGPRSRPRWLLWWTLIEYGAALATRPKTDVRAADEAIESMVARGAIGRAADRVRRAAIRRYLDSYSGRALMSLDREWTLLGRARQVRSIGAGVVVAALTSLALQRLGTEPVGLSSELVPALCAAVGALAVAFAPSIDRTMERFGG